METEVSFKARARTLDMLGRQQIAGIPTAISELFKNAHDAYAEKVEVDYYRRDRLFVLRDDGVGMATEEFVDRWLTIATETTSRRKHGAHRHRARSGIGKRPVLGEKGIGRLAIATIAPQVLVLTRTLRDDGLSDLTAAFVNWRIFECPGLDLRDIRIPLRTFPGGSVPDGEDVADMVEVFRSRNARLQQKVDPKEWSRIETELALFKLDPLELAAYMGAPTLLAEGSGTHFYLLPASPNLVYDIAGDPDSDVAAPLQKALLGFTIPSLTDGRKPVIRTAFRDHRTDGTCEDLIGESEFFNRYDYENADHQISGRFDKYGQFKGSVSVYGEAVPDHVINWRGGKGRPTDCGPFDIRFAAIEGAARHSTLPPDEHGRMLRKTRRIGGLYIYRDESVMQLGLDIEARVREAGRDTDRRRAARRIMDIETEARKSLRDLESRYRISKPRIGMTRALQREWMDYREAFEGISGSIRDIRDSIESVVTNEAAKAEVDVSARARVESALKEIGGAAKRETKAGRRAVEKAAERIRAETARIAAECVRDVDSAFRTAMAQFARLDLVGLNDQPLARERPALETPIREALEDANRRLDSLRSQLAGIDLTGESTLVDQLAAVEQHNVALKEQAAADLQLAQLGMAIEIISHEFGAAIRTVRSGLRSLKAWADANHELQSLYRAIRGSFDHLDGYLTLFTPLQRRLYRKAVDIRGWEIHEFLTNLFGQRMARHNVELTRTNAFASAAIRGYLSSFYPVFVNLVDNAIYWLSGQNERVERRIQLDASGKAFRVSDSGPGVHNRDRKDIFDIGFTRKPGGRGMGLHISRQTLREVGYDLILEDRGPDWSTTFLITPIKDENSETDAQ